MLKNLFQKRIVRFILCGIVTAAFNILLISVLIDLLNFNTPVKRNIANVLAIEVSLLFSFFVYKTWVWSRGNWKIKQVLWQEIPLYHLSCGSVVCTRILILFPVLDWLGVNYMFNSLIGIVLGSILNYMFNEKLVFKAR